MIKAYLFDLWGTLGYLNNKSKFPKHEDMLVKKFEDVCLSKEEINRCKNLIIGQKASLYEDSEEVIRELKDKGYKLAIISNIYSVSGELVKKELKNFLSLFDFVAFSYEMKVAKPDLKIFRRTLYELNISSEEAVMVGDEINNDIIPAKQIRIKTILIDRNKQTLGELI